MSEPKWEVSFKPFLNSIRTQISVKDTSELCYEFIDMSEHQAIITVKEWVRFEKEQQKTNGNV